MLDFLMIPAVVGTITFGIYKLFELFVRRRERLLLIDKLAEKLIAGPIEATKFTLPDFSFFMSSRLSFGALKAGCLLLGVGLGLFVAFMVCCMAIPDYAGSNRNWEMRETIGVAYGSCVLLFGGLSLIAAFLIETHLLKKQNR